MSDIIKVSGLTKSFGDIKALRGLDFCVKEGELFAFLGVNGAGKSTTISIMCGRLKKDAGNVTISGVDIEKDPEKIKSGLGVVFQNSLLDKALSVRDNLKSRAALYGITGGDFDKRVAEIDRLFGISELMDRTVGKLSGGQRRRVDIARALIHKPSILILDEPTTGLDPQTRKLVWSSIGKLREESDLTVFLTTHYMEEAADADYVVIIDNGAVCADGRPHELKNRFAGDSVTLYGVSDSDIAVLGKPYTPVAGGFRIELPDTSAATELIVAHPTLFRDYEIIKGGMDDVFIAATGRTPEGV